MGSSKDIKQCDLLKDRFVRGKRIKPINEKLIYKIAKNGCWIFQNALSRQGYGRIRIGNKNINAHRVSYEYHVGNIPMGMYVCHKCDNPPCINPKHLFLGTALDNNRDAIKKKRNAGCCLPGTKNIKAKLTEKQVLKMRKLRQSGMGYSRIGSFFGLTKSSTHKAIKGITWKHLK